MVDFNRPMWRIYDKAKVARVSYTGDGWYYVYFLSKNGFEFYCTYTRNRIHSSFTNEDPKMMTTAKTKVKKPVDVNKPVYFTSRETNLKGWKVLKVVDSGIGSDQRFAIWRKAPNGNVWVELRSFDGFNRDYTNTKPRPKKKVKKTGYLIIDPLTGHIFNTIVLREPPKTLASGNIVGAVTYEVEE